MEENLPMFFGQIFCLSQDFLLILQRYFQDIDNNAN